MALLRESRRILGLAVLAAACTAQAQTEVSVDPTTVFLDQGETQTFTATVTGPGDASVTWTATGGTYTEDGNSVDFTAPNGRGLFILTATSVADPTAIANAAISVASVEVSIETVQAHLFAGQETDITAQVSGSTNATVDWTSTCGELLGSGSTVTFRATMPVRTCTVTANSVADPSVSASVDVVSSYVATGYDHAFAFDGSGGVWTWGGNTWGELGPGVAGLQPMPVDVRGSLPANIVQIAAGADFTLLLDESGAVWTMGDNTYRQLGRSGDNRIPKTVTGLTASIVAVAAGRSHALALDAGGQVWAWGRDNHGQSGEHIHGNVVTTPTVIEELPYILSISAGGEHSVALDVGGDIWAWGRGVEGQLGHQRDSSSSAPQRVHSTGPVSFVSVAAGSLHTLALDATGRAWAWGAGSYGQLGIGRNNSANEPTAVDMPSTIAFAQVAAGDATSFALDDQGNLWSWGSTRWGQLGTGSPTNATSPTLVQALYNRGLLLITAGSDFALAVDANGKSWSWGADTEGQLGNDALLESVQTPVEVALP